MLSYGKKAAQKKSSEDPSTLTKSNGLKSLPSVPAVQRMSPEEELPAQGMFKNGAPVQKMGGLEEELPAQGMFKNGAPIQKMGGLEEELPAQGKFAAQLKANNTGMPDNLKSGIEGLSGMDISDVKVHYNSPKPAQLNAHAYAQGNDIHVASGQEKHLGHEAWHVVQQRQGRVQPTTQLEGVAINDDASLEHEADVMGAKALGG